MGFIFKKITAILVVFSLLFSIINSNIYPITKAQAQSFPAGAGYIIDQKDYLFGVQDFPNLFGGGPEDSDVTPDVVSNLSGALGAKSFRLWMSITSVIQRDATDDNVSLIPANVAAYQSVINSLIAEGVTHITVVGNYYLYPYGYTGNSLGNAIPDPTTDYDNYRRFLNITENCYKLLATAFPQIEYWEPGNETNSDRYLAMNGYVLGASDAANAPYEFTLQQKAQITTDLCYYTNLGLQTAHLNQITVLPGMVFDNTVTSGNSTAVKDFLTDIYTSIKSGGYPRGDAAKDTINNDYFQVLNWHPYQFGASSTTWVNQNLALYAVAQANGDNGKKVFLTELGIPDYVTAQVPVDSNGMIAWTSQQQNIANWMMGQFDAIKANMPWVETVDIFRLFDWKVNVDPSLPANSDEFSFGLFTTPNNTTYGCVPKPVAVSLFQYFNGANADNTSLYQYAKIVTITNKPINNTMVIGGLATKLGITVSNGITGTPVWSSSSPSVATVDPSTGIVKPIATGRTTIIVKYGSVSDSFTLMVEPVIQPPNSENFDTAIINSDGITGSGNLNFYGNYDGNYTLSLSSAASDLPTNGTGNALKVIDTNSNYGGAQFDLSGLVSGTSYTVSYDFKLISESSNYTYYTNYGSTGMSGSFTLTAGSSKHYSKSFTAGTGTYIKIFPAYSTAQTATFTIDNLSVTANTSILITNKPIGNMMAVNSSITLGNTLKGITGTPVWSSSAPSVATINASTGLLTAVAAGTSTITVTDGSYSDSFVLTTILPSVYISNEPTGNAMTVGDSAISLGAVTTGGLTGTAVWSSSVPTVATVNSSTGLLSAVAPGTTRITVTMGGSSNYFDLTVNPFVYTSNLTYTDFTPLPSNITLSSQSTIKSDPTYCPTGGSGTYIQVQTTNAWNHQIFTFSGNFDKTARYEFSFLMKRTDASSDLTCYYQLNSAGSTFTPFTVSAGTTLTYTTVFDPAQYSSTDLTSWNSATSFKLEFYAGTAFTASIDNIVIQKMTPCNVENFDTAIICGNNSIGSLFVRGSALDGTSACTLSLTNSTSELPTNGIGYGLKVATTSQYGGPQIYPTNLVAGTVYTLSFDIRNISFTNNSFYVNYGNVGLGAFSLALGASQTVTETFTANSTGVYFKIFNVSTVSGTFAIDNFVIINPSPITFGSYKVSGTKIITNISQGTTVGTIRAGMTVPTGSTVSITFRDLNGLSVDDTSKVVTGTSIIVDKGTSTDTYQLVIYGDVNGDGAINLSDLVQIRGYVTQAQVISGDFKLAGDLYGEGNITLNDLVGIMSYISGTGNINQNR